MARTIPRNWLLRLPALLLYSGAFGGILFSLLWYVVVLLAVVWWSSYKLFPPVGTTPTDSLEEIFNTMSILFLYTYCYALTATIFRKLLLPQSWAGLTWIVMLVLVALGSAGPYILSFMIHWRDWNFNTHYPWLLTNPVAAAVAIADRHFPHKDVFVIFAGIWAGVVGAVNLPWFFKQLRDFKPYVPPAPVAATQTATALDMTQQL